MKKVLALLIAGSVLSGVAAYAAIAKPAPMPPRRSINPTAHPAAPVTAGASLATAMASMSSDNREAIDGQTMSGLR